MPPTREWAVFDTSVYIDALRNGPDSPAGAALTRHARRSYLASVVLGELRAGVRSHAHREALDRLGAPFQALQRIVTPTSADWLAAGDGLAAVAEARPDMRDKTRQIWNDALILLTARQVDAEVVTGNLEDFRLLQRHLGGAVTPVSALR